MLERDIENLIAAFPEDFFPGHSFVLRGRQQAFAGIGRFDLLFIDAYKTNVLVELKAVTAKYENATQLAKYKEALEAQGESDILMWLVAPHIPHSVREFLEHRHRVLRDPRSPASKGGRATRNFDRIISSRGSPPANPAN
jgi:RecB family endonuclease NucS